MPTKQFYLIFLCLILLVIQGCDKPKKQAPNKQKVASPQKITTSPPPATKAQTPRLPVVWPPATKGEINLADNLLAKNYYVILDCSGSMQDIGCSGKLSKLKVAQVALKRFANIVPVNASLGLTVFVDNIVKELVPIGRNNRQAFVTAVERTYPSGKTPLAMAIEKGYLHLEAQAQKQLGYGEYTLVVVTDGIPSEGQDPTKKVKKILTQTPIQIHTIGFCIGPQHSLNMPGRTVYKAADNPAQLEQGLSDVLAEAESFDISNFGN